MQPAWRITAPDSKSNLNPLTSEASGMKKLPTPNMASTRFSAPPARYGRDIQRTTTT